VAVWGLGAVGLSVIQATKIQGATRIYGIDINQNKAEIAKKFGATEFINSKECDAKDVLLSKEKWGVHFTYDCTGNTQAMRRAL
jgi:S-(hydroxymethyl)glutathione dehydrogenase/alcohol dehydrogenase